MAGEYDTDDPRIPHLVLGIVVDNKDPRGLGRIRVRVPGLIEPRSNWAFPLGTLGGGAPQRGFFDPPDEKATVGVLFLGGDPDRPFYLGAHWGEPDGETEVPSSVVDVSPVSDAPKVKCYETAKWLLTFDDRDDNETLELRHKKSGDRIVIDGDSPGIFIHGSAAVVIEADGLVKVKALTIQLNDRVVLSGSKPI